MNAGFAEQLASPQMRYEPPLLTHVGTLPVIPVIRTMFDVTVVPGLAVVCAANEKLLGRFPPASAQASTSVIRVQRSAGAVTSTRIFAVVSGANVTRRHTAVFPGNDSSRDVHPRGAGPVLHLEVAEAIQAVRHSSCGLDRILVVVLRAEDVDFADGSVDGKIRFEPIRKYVWRFHQPMLRLAHKTAPFDRR